MPKYKAVIFDFDGTLADTYQGIFDSYYYTAKEYNLAQVTDSLVGSSIGSSPHKIFESKFGLSSECAAQATRFYRTYYAEHAISCVTLYDGIYDLLCYLQETGCKVGIATLKLECFALQMLDKMNVANLVDVVCGADAENTLDKKEILENAMKQLGVTPEEVVLIGDSENDGIGANACGVDFIAVTYGFGFKEKTDALQYSPHAVAETAFELKIKLEHVE